MKNVAILWICQQINFTFETEQTTTRKQVSLKDSALLWSGIFGF